MVVLNNFRYSKQHEKLVDFFLDLPFFDEAWRVNFKRHREHDDWPEEACIWDFVQVVQNKVTNQPAVSICVPNSVKHLQLLLLCFILEKPEVYDADKIAAVWIRWKNGLSRHLEPKERRKPFLDCLSAAIIGLHDMVKNADIVEYLIDMYLEFGLVSGQDKIKLLRENFETFFNKHLLEFAY